MKSLQEIYQPYASKSDKGTVHTYIQEYETLLEPYRHNSTVLEIGIHLGYSLETWCDYFVNSTILGVDIINAGIDVTTARYKPIFCDAASTELLEYIQDYQFDVVIDDGSHRLEDQIATLTLISPLMKQGGMYVIEDIQNPDKDIDVLTQQVKQTLSRPYVDCKVIDNRNLKGRYDDVLIIYKF